MGIQIFDLVSAIVSDLLFGAETKKPCIAGPFKVRMVSRLEPAFLLKEDVSNGCRYEHEAYGKWVAKFPLKLWHVFEVHTIKTCNPGRRHEHYSSHREDLNDLVLLMVGVAHGCF